ncbi:MAG: class I SAM-dependent methyltransferase [Candidatus Aminicenantes bacterium]|nr:class I SAM-dependent methyltransferase [Candidatus Aminicenantes bacterium]
MEQLFYQIFEQLPRVGPGNYDSTKKAFNILRHAKPLPENPKILDIGCGTGLHTVQLAKLSNGRITALDNHREFLDSLKQHAKAQGMADNIDCVPGDMGAMDFENRSFDIIWAEGSIFILGLENGLKLWKKYLKTGGMMALTDLFWLKPEAPGELKTFFDQISPGMMSREDAAQVIEACGYHCTGHFQLPGCAWWDDFYRPLENVLKDFREKYANNPEDMVIIEAFQKEIDMFRKYSDYYGYIFFILENN